MDDDRISQALARIDAATQRIASAARMPSAPAPAGDSALQARYDNLKAEAGEALQQIDRLLGSLEG